MLDKLERDARVLEQVRCPFCEALNNHMNLLPKVKLRLKLRSYLFNLRVKQSGWDV